MASGLKYTPGKYVPAELKNVDAAATVEEKIQALVKTIHAMATYINTELPRTATAINSSAGNSSNIRTITADDSISSTDGTVLGDTTANAVTATLPLASEYPGQAFTLMRSAGANTYTLAPRGSDTIAGGGSVTITTVKRYQSDSVNTNWVAL